MAVDLPFPPRYIVNYIAEKIAEYDADATWESSLIPLTDETRIPIVASQPSNTNEIWDQLVKKDTSIPLLIQYDRLMRFRTNTFYPIKKEQVALYLYGDLGHVTDAILIIQNLLDREDAAAQDVNKWSKNKASSNGTITFTNQSFTHNVYFHNIKVYQVDESRDVTELASARAVYVNKIIIEYDYHIKSGTVKDGTGSIINY